MESLYEPAVPTNDDGIAYREGQVMEQDPEARTMAKAGSKVTLIIAAAPEEVDGDDELTEPREVPDLLGKTKSSAEYTIKTAGFTIGMVDYDYSDLPIDTVISQNPKAGEMAPGNSRINLVISLGPKEEAVMVPNLIGMTEAQVQQALSAAGLRYVRGNNVDAKNTAEIDKAVAQRPAANSNIKKGEAVTVDFGLGFTVTFINDVNQNVISVVTVIRGANVTPPSPPSMTGYTFDKWVGNMTNIQKNEAVKATYKAVTFNVSVSVSGGNGGAGGGGSYAPGATVTVSYTPDSGYQLATITVNGTPLAPGANTFTMPSSDVTVVVTFEAIPGP